MTLEELKQALATDHDLRTLLGKLIQASVPPPAPGAPDALTLSNIYHSDGLYARLRDTIGDELDKRHLGTPPPKA